MNYEWQTIDNPPKGKDLLFKGYQGLYIVANDYSYNPDENFVETEHEILSEVTHWTSIKPPENIT